MNEDPLRIARALGDRSRSRELLASQTIANDDSAWDAFLAYVEANLPIFGFGFVAGAFFSVAVAYVVTFSR